ncbi:Major facilitator superfamily domain general substrate transporter [Penicillium fimorum]|uniref:Major facilitator superfamily domain general substrate transporter n=1 Tax=Penicillium fimorum TaxID=1882269 RepID=A0A9W9XUR8_9EURO|nr:Major facilitator superfamily domain general substrate transporter [Penicillium fimorum]
MESKEYSLSFTSRSTSFIPSDQQSDSRIILDDEKLPPVDGGVQAWLFLMASAMLEALVWGYAFAFGIFQDYYSTHAPFKGSDNIAVIGTCAMGIAYLVAPLAIVLMILVPKIARWVSTIGVVIMCLSLALSSFSTNIMHLILSQGIGFGIGGCFAYTPTILFMSEWFDKRRGLAFGIVWAGSGVSGIIFPLAIQWLLNQYGIEATLQISSVTLFILAVPFLYFHRPRLQTTEIAYHRLNFHFLYDKVFIIYQLGNTLEAIGFFLPTIYLPTYARTLGASDYMASLTVILVNLFTVFGSVIMGFLSDRYHVTTCILMSTVGTSFSFGVSPTLPPPLYVFCIAYGLLAGGFSSTWAGVSNEVQKANPLADATVIFPFMETGRGIGNVVSGPLSEALLKADSWKGHALGAYGTGYGTLVVCTGATALVGGLSVVARQFNWI